MAAEDKLEPVLACRIVALYRSSGRLASQSRSDANPNSPACFYSTAIPLPSSHSSQVLRPDRERDLKFAIAIVRRLDCTRATLYE